MSAAKTRKGPTFLDRSIFEVGPLEADLRRGIRFILGTTLETIRATGDEATFNRLIEMSQGVSMQLCRPAAMIQELFGKGSPYGTRATFQEQVRGVCVFITLMDRLAKERYDTPRDEKGLFDVAATAS